MADKSSTPEVIDSDGHVIEPAAVWSEYAEPEFRVLAPDGSGLDSRARRSGWPGAWTTCRPLRTPPGMLRLGTAELLLVFESCLQRGLQQAVRQFLRCQETLDLRLEDLQSAGERRGDSPFGSSVAIRRSACSRLFFCASAAASSRRRRGSRLWVSGRARGVARRRPPPGLGLRAWCDRQSRLVDEPPHRQPGCPRGLHVDEMRTLLLGDRLPASARSRQMTGPFAPFARSASTSGVSRSTDPAARPGTGRRGGVRWRRRRTRDRDGAHRLESSSCRPSRSEGGVHDLAVHPVRVLCASGPGLRVEGVFDVEAFLAELVACGSADNPHDATREVLARAMSSRAASPTRSPRRRAGSRSCTTPRAHHPERRVGPAHAPDRADHRMWAAIGIYERDRGQPVLPA